MARNLVCNDCGAKLIKGFIIDASGAYSQFLEAAYWLEGKPEDGFLGIKIGGKDQYFIAAYRCENCGLLKFYAGPSKTS